MYRSDAIRPTEVQSAVLKVEFSRADANNFSMVLVALGSGVGFIVDSHLNKYSVKRN